MKRILIKATGLRPLGNNEYRSGIPRSNVELLKAMIALNDPEIHLAVYSPSLKNPFYYCQDWPIEHHWYGLPGLKYHCRLETWWRQHLMGNHDLLHLTENADYFGEKEKFVVTIHDTDMMKESEFYEGLFRNCASAAQAIVTCSEFSKNDIIEKLNVPEYKVTAIPWGISKDLFYPRSISLIEKIKNKYNIKGDFFFACSCQKPRKNLDIILEAFSLFSEVNDDVSLVVAINSLKAEYAVKYSSLISEGRIKMINFVSDEDLATLYSGALSSILVSSLEGFGFPILESMACGTNCICCKNSSMEEIGLNKAYYVKERDAEDLASAFLYFVKNGKSNRMELINYASSFTWEKTAKRYLEFYKIYSNLD